MVDGVVGGQVGGGGFGDAGDDGGHLLLDGAVVGTEGFLVVLERDPEELVLQLQRLRQLGKVRRRRLRGVGGGGGGDRGSGGVVAVGGGNANDNADSDSDLEVVSDTFSINLRCPVRLSCIGLF